MASDAAPDLSDTPYRLLERAAHGEFGAWYAKDDRGNRFVVKPRFVEAAVEATELLRPMIVRQTAYSLKFHDAEAGPKLIRDGLELSETFPA